MCSSPKSASLGKIKKVHIAPLSKKAKRSFIDVANAADDARQEREDEQKALREAAELEQHTLQCQFGPPKPKAEVTKVVKKSSLMERLSERLSGLIHPVAA